MPIYEYDCQSCQRVFDALIRNAREEKAVACPDCDSRKVQRRPSVFAAHAASPKQTLAPRGCGRCGDPNGPCGLD